jgi:hypothetical protein
LNTNYYFDPFLIQIEHEHREGFTTKENKGTLSSSDTPQGVPGKFSKFKLPHGLGRWVKRS